MVSRTVTVRNQLGMHARASARFVHAASAFEARIRVGRGARVMDGKSIMGVLLLAAAKGSHIIVRCKGDDAEEALSSLSTLINNKFGEQ